MSTKIVEVSDAFESCVKRRFNKRFNQYEVHCTLGLWSVSSHDRHIAEREARRYWVQYLEDGEYNKVLAGKPTP